MKLRNWIKLAVVVIVVALVACLALNGLQLGNSKYRIKPVGEAITLGLDLQGGISTVYVAKDSSVENFDNS